MAARHTPFNNILDLYQRHGIDWIADEAMVWNTALENFQQLEQNKQMVRKGLDTHRKFECKETK